MKKIITLTLILASFSILQTASYGSSKLVTYVGKSNFMNAGATSLNKIFTIDQAGIYVLTENIVSSLTSGQVIKINTDNVVVDLNGYTITGQSTSNMNGIEVDTGKNNIEIKNGTIYSVGNSAIKINGSVKNLKISNITCNSCNKNNSSTAGGIYLNGGSGTEITHCAIDNCVTFSVVPQTVNAYGIFATDTKYLSINNCRSESIRNIGKSHKSYGYYIEASEYPTIINSDAYSCEGDAIGAGVYLLTCTGAKLENCTVEGSIASDVALEYNPGIGYGFYFNDTNNSTIKKCNATNNGGKNAGNGFYVLSCKNNRFINCISTGNYSTNQFGTKITSGFETSRYLDDPTKGATISCIFKNCTAIGQYSKNPLGATGFLLDSDTRCCIIENCLSSGNNSNTGSGYGIYLKGSSLFLNIIKNNNVFSNTALSPNSGYGIYQSSFSDVYTFFFENICSMNTNNVASSNMNLNVSHGADIPKIGTSISTFNSIQENIKGYNFVAGVY